MLKFISFHDYTIAISITLRSFAKLYFTKI